MFYHRFINNEWVNSVDGGSFEVVNPTTEKVITSVQEASEKVTTILPPLTAINNTISNDTV